MNKNKLLISACLIGENCKYNGGNNQLKDISALKEKYELIPVCPEQLGGLPTPRGPSEIIGDRVISKSGADVTDAFYNGAKSVLKIALANDCRFCLLKERSPSCGVKSIYDGTFSNKTILGCGITTRLLKEQGIAVYSEEEIDKLI